MNSKIPKGVHGLSLGGVPQRVTDDAENPTMQRQLSLNFEGL